MAAEAAPSLLARQLLNDLMALAGEPLAEHEVEFSGADPVFPTPFPLGEMGAAAIGAAALQAARLWEARTGKGQRITIDVDAAAAGLRSSRYIRTEPVVESPRARTGSLGVYRTRDERWIYFQRLFEHHRARLFATLNCEDVEEDIARAVAGWNAHELEEAVVAAGATAGVVRSYAEWAQHPQGQALEQLPLFEIIKIGDSPPRPLPDGARPLSGIRVLDVTRVLAGPTCGRTLAEHGAQVLRVGTPAMPDNEAMMRDTGHGKRSTVIDLSASSGKQQLERLAAGADVFSQGYRPGSIASKGFSPEAVAGLRPGIVYVSISAFGHEGPWRDRRGFDSVVQAVSGLSDESARDGVPRFLPANPLDYATGYLAAFGVMVALGRRAREGGSYHVRLSLGQTGRWLASMPRLEAGQYLACAPELPAERLAELMTSSDTPFGRLRYLKPVARMSETPPGWDRPTAPLDHDPPEWA